VRLRCFLGVGEIALKPLVQWPLWQRAILWNVTAAVGVCIGLAWSRGKASVSAEAYIVVFTVALINLMFLVAVPRIHVQRTTGIATQDPWSVIWQVLAERPFVTVLLILQLIGVSRAVATTIELFQASGSDYIRALPNAHSMTLRLMGASMSLAGVAALWLTGAIGLWRSRTWAWWLVLVLNGISATVTGVLQVMRLDKFLIDIPATGVVVLLLLRPVKMEFRRGKTAAKQVAA
jgi:hypothetical protein